jgi:hypothetical protein
MDQSLKKSRGETDFGVRGHSAAAAQAAMAKGAVRAFKSGPAAARSPQSRRARHAETAEHGRLKRLALLWAQAHGYSASAVEVSLPRCHYRADVAGYRMDRNGGTTAIFECKQTIFDLRRDNCRTRATLERLEEVHRRRQILERNLRVHYPHLRINDSLFAEFDSYDFGAIKHRGYARVLRELAALQTRLFDCTKFEDLVRYRCANLFYLVLPGETFREPEIPIGWGALVESGGAIVLARKPVWQEATPENQLRLLQRIGAAGTRVLNQKLGIAFADVIDVTRCLSRFASG